jgi:large subunit ribosomal protein L9
MKVKVDPDGHMYGSVTANEIAKLLEKEGYPILRRNVKLHSGIKTLGTHEITLALKEGVEAKFALKVTSETPIKIKETKKKAEETHSAEAETATESPAS